MINNDGVLTKQERQREQQRLFQAFKSSIEDSGGFNNPRPWEQEKQPNESHNQRTFDGQIDSQQELLPSAPSASTPYGTSNSIVVLALDAQPTNEVSELPASAAPVEPAQSPVRVAMETSEGEEERPPTPTAEEI